jgi:hypothetical protein
VGEVVGAGLAIGFLYLDHHEPVGLPDGAPGLRALRLVPRGDDPVLGRAVVNFVLFGPGHFDDRGAVGSPTFAAPRSKRVEAVLSWLLTGHSRKLPEPTSLLTVLPHAALPHFSFASAIQALVFAPCSHALGFATLDATRRPANR